MELPETLAFAASRYTCYPSETVEFHLRLEIQDPGFNGYAQLVLPDLFKLDDFHLLDAGGHPPVYASETENKIVLEWDWKPGCRPAADELVVLARVDLNAPQGYLPCQAGLFDPAGHPVARVEQRILVNRTAESMRYLPEIYNRDDLTNRFLMLIDSFWKPISGQIDQVDCYFDPNLAPPAFLPWLGSWFGLDLDQDLPVERQRALVAKIAPILAQNGTCQAMSEFLSLYTSGQVSIREHRDRNFVLGQDTFLGYQIALGTHNRPFSFDVHLQVPAHLHRDEQERQQYTKRIESLISMVKPAHAVYSLEIEYFEEMNGHHEG